MITATVTEHRGPKRVRTERHDLVKPYEAFQILNRERTAFFRAHPISGVRQGRDGQRQWNEWTAVTGERVRVEIVSATRSGS